MADSEKRLLFRIGAATTDFNKALGDMERQTKGTLGNIQKAFGSVMPALSIGAVVYGLADLMKTSSAYAEEIMLAAEKTGLTTDMLQDLNYLAKTTNTSLGGLEGGLKKMNNVISDGMSGNQAAIDLIGRLGLNVGDLAKMSQDERFTAIASGIAAIEDPALKSALAVDFLGKSGTDLIPLINALKDIDKIKPPKLSEEELKNLADVKEATEKLDAAWLNLKNQFAATVFPDLIPFISGLSGAIKKVGELKDIIKELNKKTPNVGAGSALSNLFFGNVGPISTLAQLFGIQKFASGGLVTQPTLSMIGEAGPELVVPLDRLASSGGQGGGTTVNVMVGNYMGDEISKRALVRDIQRILKEEDRRSSFKQTETSYYSVGGHL